MAGGGEACVVLPRSEVEAIRARSKKGSKQSPWDTDFNEMAKKTAFKRLAKVLPLTPEFAEAERLEDEPTDVTPKTAAAAFERPQRPALPEPQPEAERPEVEQPAGEPPTKAVAVTVVEDDAVPDSVMLATSKGFTMQEVTDYLREQGFIEKNQPPSALSAEHDASLMKSQVGFLGALGKARALKGGAK
jgi:hypothetical protein